MAAACTRGPVPPDPAALTDLDPALRTLLDQQTAAVRDAPAVADRWGMLGMAYEADRNIFGMQVVCYALSREDWRRARAAESP